MLIDTNNLKENIINSDICIIGSGPACLSFVEKFFDTEFKISILESGNFSFDQNVNSLNEGSLDNFGNFPHENYILKSARVRMIGGTSNVWAGWSGPLLKDDFKKKNWIENSGWEITFEDIKNYYHQAQKFLGLGKFIYDENVFDYLPKHLQNEKFNEFDNNFWQFSSPPLNFKKKYQKRIEVSNNIDLYYNCTACSFSAKDNQRIENISAFNSQNHEFFFQSKFFILACGGIENASLLLNSSDNVQVLKSNKNIGHFFLEHPHITIGHGITENKNNFLKAYGKNLIKDLGNVKFLPGFSIKKEIQEQHKILSCITVLSEHNLLDVESAVILRHSLALKNQIVSMPKLISYIFKNFLNLNKNVFGIINNFLLKKKFFHLVSRLEQQPTYENKIYLSNEKNKFNKFLPAISWKLTEQEYKTLKINYELISDFFKKNNLGKIKPSKFILNLNKNLHSDVFAVGHHMGTTRMSSSPVNGVVDKNLKVHDLNNLYIAGSSVFPTGGYINPTMTIVALSMRLNNHIYNLLKK